MLSSIRGRILIAIVVFEVLGYGTVATYNRLASEDALLVVRREQLGATFDATLARLNSTTDYMESVARSLAVTGARLRSLRRSGVDVTPDVQAYLVDTFNALPSAVGGGLWFQPGEFAPGAVRFGPYAARMGGQVKFTWDLNSPEYDYHNQSWYRLAIPAGAGAEFSPAVPVVWTEPYKDAAATEALMITVDAYIRDDAGRVVGLSTVDWSLEEMQRFVSDIRLTAGTHAFLVDGQKDLIVADPAHPENVMTPASGLAWMAGLPRDVPANKRTVVVGKQVDGEEQVIYWARSQAGMLLGIRVPVAELGAEARAIARTSSVITVAIATLFIGCAAMLLHVLLRPFQKVVALIREATADRDARGELQVRPIEYHAKDEFRGIVDALNEMTTAIRARDDRLSAYSAGLEARVAERTAELLHTNHLITERSREMRLVLDTVDQGLLTIDRHGMIAEERSRATEMLLGPIGIGETLMDVLARHSPRAAAWFELGLAGVFDGVLPLDLALHQLLDRVRAQDRELAIRYHPVVDGLGDVSDLLVVLSDVTDAVAAAESEQVREEDLVLFERFSADRAAFEDFIDDAGRLVEAIDRAESGPHQEARALHTLKGNVAIFGLRGLAEFVHTLETECEATGDRLGPAARAALVRRWESIRGRASAWLGLVANTPHVDVTEADYTALLHELNRCEGAGRLVTRVQSWRLEPAERRLGRLAAEAKRIGEELGRAPLTTRIDANAVRLDARVFAPLWSVLVHVIRNAVDHGIETAAERYAANRPVPATLRLSTHLEAGELVVAVEDDGRGIAWESVRRRASQQGLPSETRGDLVRALFADRITTRDSVSGYSGRGVGLAAVREVCEGLGARIEVEDRRPTGTTIRIRVPISPAGDLPMPLAWCA